MNRDDERGVYISERVAKTEGIQGTGGWREWILQKFAPIRKGADTDGCKQEGPVTKKGHPISASVQTRLWGRGKMVAVRPISGMWRRRAIRPPDLLPGNPYPGLRVGNRVGDRLMAGD